MDGKRLCCLFIPDFALQTQLRIEGLQCTEPVAIITSPPGQASTSRIRIQELSEGAKSAGVSLGMSLAEAEIQCASLLVLHYNEKQNQSASDELFMALCARFPCIEPDGPGLYYISCQGLKLLYEAEKELLKAISQVAQKQDYQGWTTSASNRFTSLAWAKAHASRLVDDAPLIVPRGREADFLAPLPIAFLPKAGDLPLRLGPLGITTLGGFARLDGRSVARRYGKQGSHLHRLAQGNDSCHLQPVRAPQDWQDHLHLDCPVYIADGLLFLMGPMLEHLMHALRREGRALQTLLLTFHLEDHSLKELTLQLAAPTEQIRVIQDLLHLKLAKLNLKAGAVAITLRFTKISEPIHDQQHLFERRASATGMAATIARLQDSLGLHAVVHASPKDAYLPSESYCYTPATPLKTKASKILTPKAEALFSALRYIHPPRALDVNVDENGAPQTIRLGSALRQALWIHGPMEYQGAWWTNNPFFRRYYRLWLKGSSEILIYLDGECQQWFLEGVYD